MKKHLLVLGSALVVLTCINANAATSSTTTNNNPPPPPPQFENDKAGQTTFKTQTPHYRPDKKPDKKPDGDRKPPEFNGKTGSEYGRPPEPPKDGKQPHQLNGKKPLPLNLNGTEPPKSSTTKTNFNKTI